MSNVIVSLEREPPDASCPDCGSVYVSFDGKHSICPACAGSAITEIRKILKPFLGEARLYKNTVSPGYHPRVEADGLPGNRACYSVGDLRAISKWMELFG